MASLQPLPVKKPQFRQAFARMRARPIASGSGEMANMRTISILGLALLLVTAASAQVAHVEGGARRLSGADDQADAHWDRAYELRPRRRDEPLRYLNISDNEVREIQLVAEKYLPKVLAEHLAGRHGLPVRRGPAMHRPGVHRGGDRAVIERAADVASQERMGGRERAAVVVEARRARRPIVGRWAMRSMRAQ